MSEIKGTLICIVEGVGPGFGKGYFKMIEIAPVTKVFVNELSD